MHKIDRAILENQDTEDLLGKLAFEVARNEIVGSVVNTSRFSELKAVLDSYIYSRLDRRIGSRINVEQIEHSISGHFSVVVDAGREQLTVRPIDLSLTDICVEPPEDIFEHGVRVDIILAFHDIKIVLPAIAVRQDRFSLRTAFLFVTVGRDKESDSRFHLNVIFQSLKAQADKLRYWRAGCLLLSAGCSIALIYWMFF